MGRREPQELIKAYTEHDQYVRALCFLSLTHAWLSLLADRAGDYFATMLAV
jgi:hypothetical protein